MSPIFTSTPVVSESWKPGAVAVTVYMPLGRGFRVYLPWALVLVDFEKPVGGLAALVAVIVAPLMGRPLVAAVTVPFSWVAVEAGSTIMRFDS